MAWKSTFRSLLRCYQALTFESVASDVITQFSSTELSMLMIAVQGFKRISRPTVRNSE